MAASCGFSRTSCGYVGRSDGWQDISGNFKMDWEFGSALDGNIALTGEIPPGAQREFVVAIALGQGHHDGHLGAGRASTRPLMLL